MTGKSSLISSAFEVFLKEAPEQAAAWNALVQNLSSASALDKRTSALAYLAVLAALGMENGIPFHVHSAKQSGATRDEVISAVLLGLPAAGHAVTRVLPSAVTAYDTD